MLVYVFIPLIICNFYWTLLPALKIQKHLIRIAVMGCLALLAFRDPILIFLYTAVGFWGTVYLLLTTIVKGEKVQGIYRITLIGLFTLLTALTALFLFGMIFYANDYDYYAIYPFVIYLFTLIWALIRNRDWVKKHFKTASCICLIFPLLLLSLHWGYRNNPTTFLHTETVKISQKTTTYRNKDILKLLKKVEQLIVLDIHSQFKNVKSVSFVSIREHAQFREGGYRGRFEATVLVNHLDKMTYDFNLSYDEDDYEPSFIESSSYSSKMHLKSKNKGGSPVKTIDQLTNPYSKNILKNVKIHYYLKNDIYKNN